MVDYFKDDELVEFTISSKDGTLSEDIVLPRLLVNDVDASIEYLDENYNISPLNVVVFCALILFFAFVEKSNLLNIVIDCLGRYRGDDE